MIVAIVNRHTLLQFLMILARLEEVLSCVSLVQRAGLLHD